MATRHDRFIQLHLPLPSTVDAKGTVRVIVVIDPDLGQNLAGSRHNAICLDLPISKVDGVIEGTVQMASRARMWSGGRWRPIKNKKIPKI